MTDSAPTGAMSHGWYDDPAGGGGLRYWDGSAWTDHTRRPASDGSPPPKRGSRRGVLLAAMLVLALAVGAGIGLLIVDQRAGTSGSNETLQSPVSDDAEDRTPEVAGDDGLDTPRPSEEFAGDIEVARPEGAVYFLYSLRGEDGEQIDDVIGVQIDAARRVSRALVDLDVDANAYCVGSDILIVAVSDDPGVLSEIGFEIDDALGGDLEASIFTTDAADVGSDSSQSLVQCQARDGRIVRQGGSGTFP